LKAQDVQLESNAGRGAVQFRGFAGAVKAHLQWLPLQWTYLVKGACKVAAANVCVLVAVQHNVL
jgi:hypothetical protein